MMKNYLINISVILTILLLSPAVTGQSSTINLQSATFSDSLEEGSSYQWNIDNYQIGGTRVENKQNINNFEFIHGSDIFLDVLQNPSDFDLTDLGNLTNPGNLSDYFSLTYDEVEFDFNKADPLYIWIFPTIGLRADGGNTNLLTSFWIYNVFNILVTGDSLTFNSTLPDAEVSSSTEDGELTITFEHNQLDLSIQAVVQEDLGILNDLNLVSDSFRLEIDRRGGGSGFIPVSPFYALIPLIVIPVIRKIRKK